MSPLFERGQRQLVVLSCLSRKLRSFVFKAQKCLRSDLLISIQKHYLALAGPSSGALCSVVLEALIASGSLDAEDFHLGADSSLIPELPNSI